jgi:hypothetical protein
MVKNYLLESEGCAYHEIGYPYNLLTGEDITPIYQERVMLENIKVTGDPQLQTLFTLEKHPYNKELLYHKLNLELTKNFIESNHLNKNGQHILDVLVAYSEASQFLLNERFLDIEIKRKSDGSLVGAPDILCQHAMEYYLRKCQGQDIKFEGEELSLFSYEEGGQKFLIFNDSIDGSKGLYNGSLEPGVVTEIKIDIGLKYKSLLATTIHPKMGMSVITALDDLGKLVTYVKQPDAPMIRVDFNKKSNQRGRIVLEDRPNDISTRIYGSNKAASELRDLLGENFRNSRLYNNLKSSTSRTFTSMLNDTEAMLLLAPYKAHDVSAGIKHLEGANIHVYQTKEFWTSKDGEKYAIIIAGREKGHCLYMMNKLEESIKNCESEVLKKDALPIIETMKENLHKVSSHVSI